MGNVARVALEQRLERAEEQLQRAFHGLDGSPASRTALHLARVEYRLAEELALAVLGARDALAIVETHAVEAVEATVA